ncbi:uncharacterized protein EV420DRAFT_1600781 [Desarmillaria tabescens]|uniref:Uncharacterized protein n=1 Tax=Armillaria tabescens TaxID=1929756 RepID=A0AA39IZJ1_ARMTA|nr:uncharacterized protein EV420DRAFT_1600781 [Desarmillaria tabescens]KAK0433386.1 hypothetical protein EV420DRAFT_1600781 [Desarmillaria tabescens]
MSSMLMYSVTAYFLLGALPREISVRSGYPGISERLYFRKNDDHSYTCSSSPMVPKLQRAFLSTSFHILALDIEEMLSSPTTWTDRRTLGQVPSLFAFSSFIVTCTLTNTFLGRQLPGF